MKIKKLIIYLLVILVLFTSCERKDKAEDVITEEQIREDAEALESSQEDPVYLDSAQSMVPSGEDMASLVTSALSIYDETRIKERPLVPVAGDDGLCYLQFAYLEEMGGYVLESGPYYRGTLYIPSEIDGIPVVAIADYAFAGSKSLTFIGPLPETIRLIGKKAFCDCTELGGELVLPSGLEIIDEYAFSNTAIGGTLCVPQSVREIRKGAFKSSRISSLIMDEGIESIGEEAFAYDLSLSGDIYIPASVKSIGSTAFDHCHGLDGSYLVTPAGFFQVSIERDCLCI